jgi:radical SAM superfamily enzyme YgiQ (UPF0313 family)
MRTPASIAAEVRDLWIDYGVAEVFFTDDIFTLNRRWLRELLAALSSMEHRVTWGCATRVDLVDADLVQAMAGAGCTGIQFGVETGSQRILDSVKGIQKQQAVDAVEVAIEAGVEAVCSFMVPFPEDTRETLRESLEFMRELRGLGARIFLSYTCPYPGTTFYENAGELGLRILSDDWGEFDAKHVVIETQHLSADEITSTVEAMADDLGLPKSSA